MSRVVVTGASGFIGRHLVPHLVAQGHEVHVLGRRDVGGPDVTSHLVDLFDDASVVSSLRKIEASHLVHLAWSVPPGTYWYAPANLDWVAASLRLVRGFVEAGGMRVVAAGTCAEYGWGPPILREGESIYAPRALYGAAKDALRRLLLAYAEAAPFSCAWGHVFFLYGPGEPEGRLVSEAVRRLLAGHPFDTTKGSQLRDFLHVHDVAGAFAALLDSPVEGPINIASGQAVRVRTILDAVAHETGRPDLIRFGARPTPANEPPIIEAATELLTRTVKFVPHFDVSSGVANTVAWWRENGMSGSGQTS